MTTESGQRAPTVDMTTESEQRAPTVDTTTESGQRSPSVDSTIESGNIAIIGGGLAGLAAAATLSRENFDVFLFEIEKRDRDTGDGENKRNPTANYIKARKEYYEAARDNNKSGITFE